MIDTKSFTVHDRLPDGFGYANDLQVAEFNATGSINGASKIAQVRNRDTGEIDVAVRLRPPRFLKNVLSMLGRSSVESAEEYIADYNAGWRAARAGQDMVGGADAWEDGFLDAAAGRIKWHLTYCTDHDHCGEG